MRTLKTSVLLFIIILFPYQAIASDDIRKITVTGKSEIVMDAHFAVIQLIIRELKDEMGQSHSDLIKTIFDLSGKLKSIGLTDADIKKSLILQGQDYFWKENEKILRGYYSECHIDLYVTNIDKIAFVYKELANFQEISIRSTDFKRNDEFEIRKSEFEKALKAAKLKAEYMTRVLGTQIGKVHTIEEISANDYLRSRVTDNVRSFGSGNDQTGYGTIKIDALVAVVFELE
ncbi:MAG: SIMPL domain-containing protein [Deltaproteobacteria bacterium]|nr:SIMPL domain-containing protein [Deltaproteobacteria bacterium]